MTNRSSAPHGPVSPWWRHRMVWLAVGGPLAVVVASFVTLYLAITRPDPVLATPSEPSRALQPAVQARNHAATP